MTKPIDFTKPVQTKGGAPVKILCTDAKCHYCVVGLVLNKSLNYERVYQWDLDGLWSEHPFGGTNENDLENVITRHTGWINIKHDVTDSKVFSRFCSHVFTSLEAAREAAHEAAALGTSDAVTTIQVEWKE